MLKRFKDGKVDVRPECVCYYCLPAGKVGRVGAGVVEVEPGGSSYSCAHTAWRQVFFVLEGRGWLVLDAKKRYPIQKDMVVEIPYDVEHKVVASRSGKLRYLYINDYSQPVPRNSRESAQAYKKVKKLAEDDLIRGEKKMIEHPPEMSLERKCLAKKKRRK